MLGVEVRSCVLGEAVGDIEDGEAVGNVMEGAAVGCGDCGACWVWGMAVVLSAADGVTARAASSTTATARSGPPAAGRIVTVIGSGARR